MSGTMTTMGCTFTTAAEVLILIQSLGRQFRAPFEWFPEDGGAGLLDELEKSGHVRQEHGDGYRTIHLTDIGRREVNQ